MPPTCLNLTEYYPLSDILAKEPPEKKTNPVVVVKDLTYDQ